MRPSLIASQSYSRHVFVVVFWHVTRFVLSFNIRERPFPYFYFWNDCRDDLDSNNEYEWIRVTGLVAGSCYSDKPLPISLQAWSREGGNNSLYYSLIYWNHHSVQSSCLFYNTNCYSALMLDKFPMNHFKSRVTWTRLCTARLGLTPDSIPLHRLARKVSWLFWPITPPYPLG